MLHLIPVLLSCGALCLASPVPLTTGTACTPRSLVEETLSITQTLKSKGSSKITLGNNVVEAGGNLTTYLGAFIEALRNSKEKEETLIVHNLQTIRNTMKPCLSFMEEDWKAEEEEDNFNDLEYLLRFLNHYVPSA